MWLVDCGYCPRGVRTRRVLCICYLGLLHLCVKLHLLLLLLLYPWPLLLMPPVSCHADSCTCTWCVHVWRVPAFPPADWTLC